MKVDFIVAGGGLAGSILAWTLRKRGRSVVLFDGSPGPVCSRAAAGLYHPLTGRRLTVPRHLPDLLEAGDRFFESVEAVTGTPCLHRLAIRRSFVDRAMAETWAERRANARAAGLDLRDFASEPDGLTSSPFGGYELRGCGWMDPAAFLKTVAEILGREGRYGNQIIKPDRLESCRDGVICGEIQARAVIFAEGHVARDNPLWKHLPLKPNHGEILEIRIEGDIRPCIHLGELFLIPRDDQNWLAGATHDWTVDHGKPTPAGRREIENKLKAFLRCPFQVVGHRAGVRPASGDTMPFLGRHHENAAIWIFNGFGSRTLLMAPWCAEKLDQALTAGESLPEELDIHRFEPVEAVQAKPFRATRAAQDRIAEVLCPGDLAIDATAGRGHDTIWLAERVGPAGRVLAIDIQPRAIEDTGLRLRKAGLAGRVNLVRANHADLAGLVPPDWSGQVAAILFNLGSLPHGDRNIRTRPESTLKALETAPRLLKANGRITIVLNPGDPAGRHEEQIVRSWMMTLSPDRFAFEEVHSPDAPPPLPGAGHHHPPDFRSAPLPGS
ncbi:MAG: FAD-dependent oxidoreductase [Opitutaceae bacterium]